MLTKRRIHFSLQLFLYVAPLIILPICIVAFLGYTISASSMTRLSRDKLLGEAKTGAASIDMVFDVCHKDLETLWLFFFAEAFDVRNPKDFSNNFNKLISALHSFKNSFPMYLQIGFWDASGDMVVSSDYGMEIGDFLSDQERRLVMYISQRSQNNALMQNHSISPVLFSDRHRGYVVTVGKTVYSPDGEILGCLMIDLDFDQLVNLIRNVDTDTNSGGYAFLVDFNGNAVFHPDYAPYDSSFSQANDLLVREFILDTIMGRSGFRIYTPHNKTSDNMAAYAPVKNTGWTLVKTVPLSEFTQSAATLRNYIVQVGFITVIIAVFLLWYLAYRVNRPILKLANATRELATGNLDVDLIPITPGTYETMELTNDFNIMAKNLRRIQAELVVSEKMAALGRLSAGVAHELRNPLNAIKLTIVYMGRHRKETEVFDEAAGTLYQEIERLNKFVNDFLSYAKQTPPNKVPGDLAGLIRKVMVLNQEQADSLNIKVNFDAPENLPLVPMDNYQMMQVFFNIYNNALQAMSDGGVFDISIKEDVSLSGRCGLKAVFSDTGKGIDAEQLNNVFEPFFTTKESGTGLGLAISLSIIEAHGGVLAISNNETRGAKVEIFLPLDE